MVIGDHRAIGYNGPSKPVSPSTMRNLHPHQATMLNQVKGVLQSTTVHAGVAVAPPAFGKTSVIVGAIDYIASRFVSSSKTLGRNSMSGVSLMLTPYLILNQQQTEELDNLEIRYPGEDFDSMPKMIGTFDSENMNTSKQVMEFINTAHAQNKYPVIVSTYKSAVKLGKIKFDAILCDEAHHVCEKENYNTVFQCLNIDAKKIFFTATPRIDGDLMESTNIGNRAMNNIDKFGPFISMVSFKSAIKYGYVLKPRLVFIETHGKNNFEHHVVDMVVKSIGTMKSALDGADIASKTIFVCDSIAVVDAIKFHYIKSPELFGGAKVFTAHSGEDGYAVNGVTVPGSGKRQKERFSKTLRECEGDCILVHVDTMGEGISIPGFTGVVFVNVTGIIRIIQNLGRAMRIHPRDRSHDGLAKHHSERIKKHALVGIISFNEDDADKRLIEGIVGSMRQDAVRKFAADHLDIPVIDRLRGSSKSAKVGGGENLLTDTQRLLYEMVAQAEVDDADDEFIDAETVIEVDSRVHLDFDNNSKTEIDPIQERADKLERERKQKILMSLR